MENHFQVYKSSPENDLFSPSLERFQNFKRHTIINAFLLKHKYSTGGKDFSRTGELNCEENGLS